MYYAIDNPMISDSKKRTPEELESAIRKELKLDGVVEKSPDNLRYLDENAMGEGGVLPVSFYKNGSPHGGAAKLLTREEMEGMLDYVERMATNIGKRIYEGDKKISPMCTDSSDACKYCDFKAICRFDEKIPGFVKRDGKEIDDEKARSIVYGGNPDELYLFD